MARSYRHAPIFGITCSDSEKQDKRIANRRLRHALKQAVARGDEVLPAMREVSNVWDFAKDGRRYDVCASKKDMRK